MKEIKAYVREPMATRVVAALEQAGCRDFSVVDVRGITGGLAREAYSYSVELGEQYEPVVKFEIVCQDDDVERLAGVIFKAASTGKKGDGIIFIAPVDGAIRISTGVRGEQALTTTYPKVDPYLSTR